MATDDTDEGRLDDGRDDRDDGRESIDAIDRESEDESVRSATVEEVDERIVDLLSWILDTETRAKIYVYLLANPGSTSEEVATGTGLYPSTVREALAELHDEDRVSREKRASEGAGNNPYEYTAIQPSELVGGVVDQVQQELNTIFTLDRVLDRHGDGDGDSDGEMEPVTITVDETEPLEDRSDADDGPSLQNDPVDDGRAEGDDPDTDPATDR